MLERCGKETVVYLPTLLSCSGLRSICNRCGGNLPPGKKEQRPLILDMVRERDYERGS